METTTFHEKGNISIHTENIFPIIKKFLYSDHEIFLRELVSNAVDATQKIKRLASMGEYGGELGDLTIKVSINPEAKTLTISDKGLGMTADEIKKYINQIAFSGALEFVEKYKDQGVERGAIIGQFGLGFYSAFMVASQVEIITKSYQDAPAARWICDGSTEFEITAADKADRGTDIILHITEDSQEFLEPARIRTILEKYGKFLPIPVSFEDKVINETEPIWTKNPNELVDEDYLKFYETLYPFSEKPLFWIHLNVDYPFNLTGILYFPKIKNELQLSREKIQLYSRQVFITDEVKDVVPDFLMLLHGVIDSPDIPLNVSRSFLQADSNVKKINGYITRKVADKLSELFNNDRHGYEEKFGDIGVFVKYGMISEDKFYDKAKDFVLLESTGDTFYTLEEYKEKTEETQKDKDDNLVWLYTTDTGKQDSYIQTAMARGYNVLKLDGVIDPHFIGKLEQKLEKTTFKRVDADSLDKLIDKGVTIESILTEEEKETLKATFEGVAGAGYSVEIQPLSTDELPVVITQNEFMRRMNDMSKAGGQPSFFGSMPVTYNLLINANHPAISRVKDSNDQALAKQLVDLALLSQGLLSGPALTEFIKRTVNGL
ncbi:molecular chaperone HtpG [Siphonobacter sp. SORGH_AS_0500]|uniref:molecular chaperone HtpG n=1 Tax=Siphonobacter sp. SORGH_AS_0500 TaxID=1864824 RepID=UPI002859AE80|nr:molecular chaperone HtpG [Siphonobacter sp. SORGH_AS_0500]MDR6196024.1 molecular chaperone HtpG [Siphonobacter sp. SORGH_AS_0500]